MALSKFFVLLKNLSADELVGYYKYLKQTQGKDSISVLVFEYFKPFYPEFSDEKKMDLDYAHDKIFRKRKAEDGRRTNLPNTISDLNLLLKEFLILEKIRDDKQSAELLWLNILHERNLTEWFSRQTDALYQKTVSQTKIQSDDGLKNAATVLLQFRNLTEQGNRFDLEAMQACLETLNVYMETIRFKLACQVANVQKLQPKASGKNDPADLPKKKEGPLTVLLHIYQDIFKMIETEDKAAYFRICQLLTEHIEHIEADELDGIMRYLNNFIAAKVRKDTDPVWTEWQHQLNLFSLEHGIFTRSGYISSTQFTNIVDIACSNGEIPWVEKFIREYLPKLKDKVQKDTEILSNAIILFYQEKFSEVKDLLPKQQIQSESKDLNYIIRARQMILRCYFEVKEAPDDIMKYCIALETILLRTNKPRPEPVQALLVFVQICKIMLMRKITREALIKRIESEPNLFARKWLLKMAQQYKK